MTEAFQIEIVDSKRGKKLADLNNLSETSTLKDVKREFQKKFQDKYASRQAYKTDPKGKLLKDEMSLKSIGLKNNGKLYYKDLGPQIGWTTVFLAEYAGPLLVYLIFYFRPSFIYGATNAPRHFVADFAMYCWVGHYAKRLLETLFIHRFSNATMPFTNLFKNCSYYWGFTAFVSYFNNHPLYTPPTFGNLQFLIGFAGFLICQLGNFSIHVALRNLRPPGSKERKIPYPTSNPLTILFSFVSCPNYTYEVGSWIHYSIMCQSLPSLLFTVAGFYQMAVWAKGKHRNYKQEFKNYPRGRKAIIPFLI